jgi:putative glycosyltransferase (TIGR04348 family)
MIAALGHDVIVEDSLSGPADALVALHARRSRDSVARFAKQNTGPLIVALTGTDLYGDLADGDEDASDSVRDATHLIVLQPRAIEALDRELRAKARVIYQSTEPPRPAPQRATPFRVCVVGHMRPIKDPFRTAAAARRLSPQSKVRVVHVGSVPDEATAQLARSEQLDNPRYRWLGELSREHTLIEIARSQLLCLTSRMEGGANVVTEALACGTPVLSSRIDGSIGLLGESYPGYFAAGDTADLAAALVRASTDAEHYADLVARCEARRHITEPATERASWRELLAELSFS